jgi:hypothetical protein
VRAKKSPRRSLPLFSGNGARKYADTPSWCGRSEVLVRGEWLARWEPQEESMMSIAAYFPSVKKPRFIDQEKSRQWWLKVMRTGLIALQQGRHLTILVDSSLASSNVEPAHNTTKYFVPNLRWGCQSHRFAWNKGYERIEWKIVGPQFTSGVSP